MKWLALQLAKEGYPVSRDLTKLLGGEILWGTSSCRYASMTSLTTTFYIGIRRRIAISFTPSWVYGFYDLLTKLEDDKILKNPRFTTLPEEVFLHYVSRTNIGEIEITSENDSYPAVRCSDLSFPTSLKQRILHSP